MSVCMSVRSRISKTTRPNFTRHFLYVLTVAATLSFSDNNAIRYVLPVLWMTSYLPIMGHMARGEDGVYSVTHQSIKINV